MKMAVIVYNEAIDFEAMELIDKNGLKNYTKITGVFGSGKTSGTHLGNDIWPGRNNILFVACEEKEAKELILRLNELRKTLGKEGIKGFILALEDFT